MNPFDTSDGRISLELTEKAQRGFTVCTAYKDELLVSIRKEFLEEFKTLILRGSNTWDQASPEMKQFCDLVLKGRVVQDYRSQGHKSVDERLSTKTN